MHEIGIVRQLVRTVSAFAEENGLTEISEVVVDCGELSLVIPEYVEELAAHQREAERIISQINSPQFRMLLRLYYLNDSLLSWSDVADRMHYELQSIYNMHGQALLVRRR